MSSLHRELLRKKRFDTLMIANMAATERMEKRKAMGVASKTTTVGGLQSLFHDLAEIELPEVSSHIPKCIASSY